MLFKIRHERQCNEGREENNEKTELIFKYNLDKSKLTQKGYKFNLRD